VRKPEAVLAYPYADVAAKWSGSNNAFRQHHVQDPRTTLYANAVRLERRKILRNENRRRVHGDRTSMISVTYPGRISLRSNSRMVTTWLEILACAGPHRVGRLKGHGKSRTPRAQVRYGEQG
jgi:hypothetical protein